MMLIVNILMLLIISIRLTYAKSLMHIPLMQVNLHLEHRVHLVLHRKIPTHTSPMQT